MKKNIGLTVLLALISIVAILPFYIMIVMGTYYSNDLFKQIVLLPDGYLWENLQTVFKQDFLRLYWNSTYVAVLTTVGSVLMSAAAGYAFAKYRFKGQQALFNATLALMMIPTQLGLIAFVWEMKQFGWLSTHLPLIIPPMASPFGVFWMTQYIKGNVPTEVIESGRIDGARESGIFFRIVLPFLKPALTSLALLAFLASWNNFLTPLATISKAALYTLPLGIANMGELYRIDYGAQLLGLSLATLPVIALFACFSKSLIGGLSAVAVKG